MKIARLIDVASDLSETSFENAWEMCHKPKNCTLIVGTKDVRIARCLKFPKDCNVSVFVNPEWEQEWLVNTLHYSVFSESA